MFYDELAKARKISDNIDALNLSGVLGSDDSQELKTALRLDLMRLRKKTIDLTKVKQVSNGR
jgi:transposase